MKKDGSIIKAVVTKVSESDVEYRNFGASTERIYSIKTSSIISINYEDGTVDKFSSEDPNFNSAASESGTTKANPDVEKNKGLIRIYNSSTLEFGGIFAKMDKRAYYGLIKYAVSDDSILATDDLIIGVEAGIQKDDGYSSTYNSVVGKDAAAFAALTNDKSS